MINLSSDRAPEINDEIFFQVLLNTFVIIFAVNKVQCADDLLIRKDGSYKFDYSGPDSFHQSQANRNNVVRGKFGGRNPETGNFSIYNFPHFNLEFSFFKLQFPPF